MANVLKPQKGAQEMFLSTPADIAVYGGAAGGGKTYALLLELLRNINIKDFNAVVFRRNSSQIFNTGGLWDNAITMYTPLGGVGVKTPHPMIKFPSGAYIRFAHLQYDKDKNAWQGGQIALLCCEVSTPVLMVDGTYKKISDIEVGDKVKTLQGVQIVTNVGLPKFKDCVLAELPNGNAQIQSKNHKVLTKNGWKSYEDFYQPIQCCNNQEFSSCKHSLSQTHHKAVVEILQDSKHIRKFYEQYVDLSQLTPERFVCRMLNDVRQLLTSSSIEFHFVHRFFLLCEQIFLSFQQLLADQNVHQEHITKQFELHLRHQFLLAIYVGKVLLTQDNNCGEFEGHIQNNEQRALFHRIFGEPVLMSHKLFQENASCTFLRDVVSCVQTWLEQQDLINCYSAYLHQCGEQPNLCQDNNRNDVLTLNDVVVQIPNDLQMDEQDIIRRGNRNKLQYVHPYTGEEQMAVGEFSYQPLKFTPVGYRLVRDITVSSDNHYITKGGIVNKNCFDEVTHFTSSQFWYMLSRNRSVCGVKPYVRATCNPDADSWLASFMQWWWDPETGYPIPERSGVIRYFARYDDRTFWGDTKEELLAEHPQLQEEMVKSFTFISAKLTDNKILMENDPGYLGNLLSQNEIEKERLLYGNWKIRPAVGMYFKRHQFEIVDTLPCKVMSWVRAWDFAATVPNEHNPSPDATAGVLMGKLQDGRYIVADVKHERLGAGDVRKLVMNTAVLDRLKYKFVEVTIPQDPGQAGKEQSASYVSMLAGFTVNVHKPTGSKITRATPYASQVQVGNVLLLKGDWNEDYLSELEGFPDANHDDQVDASSDAFNSLQKSKSWAGLIT